MEEDLKLDWADWAAAAIMALVPFSIGFGLGAWLL